MIFGSRRPIRERCPYCNRVAKFTYYMTSGHTETYHHFCWAAGGKFIETYISKPDEKLTMKKAEGK